MPSYDDDIKQKADQAISMGLKPDIVFSEATKAQSRRNAERLGAQSAGYEAESQKYGKKAFGVEGLGYTLYNPESKASLDKLAAIAAVPLTAGTSLAAGAAITGGATLAGELARQAGNQEQIDLGKAAKKGVVSGVTDYGVGKGLSLVGKGVKGTGNLVKKGVDTLADKSTNAFLNVSPSAWQKAADQGLDLTQLYKKWGSGIGGNYDTALGSVGKADDAGSIGKLIADRENVITETAKAAGNNIKISGDELITGLQQEAAKIRGELGGAARANALDEIIKQAQSKYKNGITIQQARDILREGNQKFGKSIVEDTGDAVASAAQKMEANVMRSSLKKMFPDVAQALDDEAELITLREVIKGARGKSKVGKFNTGKLDISRPGTAIDTVLNSRPVSSRLSQASVGDNLLQRTGDVVQGEGMRQLGRLGVQSSLQSAQGEAEPLPTEPSLASIMQPQGVDQSMPDMGGLTLEKVQQAKIMDALSGGRNAETLDRLSTLLTPQSAPKRTEAQVARDDLNNQVQDIVSFLGQNEVKTGAINAPIQGLLQKVSLGDQPTAEFNTRLASIKATLAKARAGTSFTPNEQKLLDLYTPTVGDSKQQVMTKLSVLQQILGSQPDAGVPEIPESIQQLNF